MGGRRPSGPKTRSRPKKRRAPWWARLSLVFGIVLVVASGGSLAAGAIVLDRVNGSLHQDTLLDSGSRKHKTGSAPTGPIDILLAGSDLRDSWQSTGMKPRTDSIMWLHIPASHDRAYLLSIPRDLVVTIPADTHTGYQGGTSRINASFPFGMRDVNDTAGGMQLLSKTLTELTGAHFDMAGLVNWDGFRAITRALGGVTMCLDKGFTSTQPGFTDGPPLTFKAGCHHYDANMALKLVRQRDNLPDGDYGRQKLQQQFIKQILKEATNKGLIANPGKLSQIIDAAGQSVTLDLGGYSITNLVLALHHITADKIVTLQVPHHSLGTADDYQGEALNQPLGDQLFAAMRGDTMSRFVLDHPELINQLPDQ